MKALKIVLSIAMVASIASCNMNNQQLQPNLSNQIIGTYKGNLTSSLSQNAISATAEITSVNDYTIHVHCYNSNIDTTLTLGLYPDANNMMRVCFTGDDFKNQYGHNMSASSQMMGNNQMMGYMGSQVSWQQHMSSQHNSGDEHYGYFDMNAKTFSYTFKFMGNASSYTQHFIGKR